MSKGSSEDNISVCGGCYPLWKLANSIITKGWPEPALTIKKEAGSKCVEGFRVLNTNYKLVPQKSLIAEGSHSTFRDYRDQRDICSMQFFWPFGGLKVWMSLLLWFCPSFLTQLRGSAILNHWSAPSTPRVPVLYQWSITLQKDEKSLFLEEWHIGNPFHSSAFSFNWCDFKICMIWHVFLQVKASHRRRHVSDIMAYSRHASLGSQQLAASCHPVAGPPLPELHVPHATYLLTSWRSLTSVM